MAKYKPSFVDVSGFSKALTDQLIRNAQINVRREQVLDNNMNQFLRMYTGKVRPVDMNKFNDKFMNFSDVGKMYMRANRGAGSRQNLSELSMAYQMAKKDMTDFSDNSRKLGEIQRMLSRVDRNKVRDTQSYNQTIENVNTNDVDEIINTYGSLDKIPLDFAYKPEKFNVAAFQNKINALGKTIAKTPVNWVPVLNPDGSQKTEEEIVSVMDSKGQAKSFKVNVPLKQYNISVNPNQIREIVGIASNSDLTGIDKDFLNNFKDQTLSAASNQQDPNEAMRNSELINYAMSKYGKNNPADLSGEDLYSAFLVKNSDLGTIIQKDYDKLGDNYGLAAKQSGITLTDERLKDIRLQRQSKKKNDDLRALNTVMNTFRTASNLGLWGMDETGDAIVDIINKTFPKLKIKKSSLIDAIKNKRDIADEEAEVIGEENYQK
jgi:transcriptional regulator of met regulon